MITPKADYSIPEAAVALSRSTEYVRHRLPKQDDRRSRHTRLTHAQLMEMALPGMTGHESPVMRDGVNYYTKDEIMHIMDEAM
jgi:hypothetical protein